MTNGKVKNQEQAVNTQPVLSLKNKAIQVGFSYFFKSTGRAFHDANYELSCHLALSESERDVYALYSREGEYFLLVDIFHDSTDVSDEAKKIITGKYPYFFSGPKLINDPASQEVKA